MYLELQLLSPLVPTRHFYILRYSQQIEQGTWAVVDVSYNVTGGSQMVSHSQCRRSPSGCLIQDMPNGYSKVFPFELHCLELFRVSSHSTMLTKNRSLGLSMWKWKIKAQLIGFLEILFIAD